MRGGHGDGTAAAAGAHVRHINWAVKWTGTPAERPGALRGRLFGEKVRCEELIFFFFLVVNQQLCDAESERPMSKSSRRRRRWVWEGVRF